MSYVKKTSASEMRPRNIVKDYLSTGVGRLLYFIFSYSCMDVFIPFCFYLFFLFFPFTQLFFHLSGQSLLTIELVKNLLIDGEFKL